MPLAGKRSFQTDGLSLRGDSSGRRMGEKSGFRRAAPGLDTQIHAVTLSGNERTILSTLPFYHLADGSISGRARPVFAPRRELGGSWFGSGKTSKSSTFPGSTTPIPPNSRRTEKTVLMGDQGAASGRNFAVGLRRADGSGVVRLGEGAPLGLSPDGKWALAYLPHPEPAQMILLPTGPGEPRALTPRLDQHIYGQRNVGSRRKESRLPWQRAPPRGARLYVQGLDGGKALPIYSGRACRGGALRLSGRQVRRR